ncbi:MarR family winged helix-turn-helix transcriptional regulator [Halobacteriovorax sp.]|uniref:MarR family winged helix-turn-helix transcriptional regulator n=1 Tax=Halobacteriovorax sp. TaxID=2020862 RepID=UPI003562966D
MSRLKFEDRDMNIIAKMSRTIKSLEKMVSVSMEEFSLTKPQLDVLVVIKFSSHDALKATEIAEELFVSKANISGLISRLESAGFIERAVDPDDSRAKKLTLSSKANDVLDKVLPKYITMTNKIMSKFSEEEKTILVGQLEYIESSMSRGGIHEEK